MAGLVVFTMSLFPTLALVGHVRVRKYTAKLRLLLCSERNVARGLRNGPDAVASDGHARGLLQARHRILLGEHLRRRNLVGQSSRVFLALVAMLTLKLSST